MKTMVDMDAARELELYAVNTGELYRRMVCPAIENLRRKASKGQYNQEKAVKLFSYTADEAAKMYHREFCGAGRYYDVFNKATRQEVAKNLEEYYREEVFYNLPTVVAV